MAISRRTFLRGTALPFAAGLVGQSQAKIVVVGAGAFGGWTALHLRRLGAKVTLIDSWGPGNARSSSGGETRVIRAIYGADREYTEMVRRAFPMWETLDASTDETLYVETGALWFFHGDDGYAKSSLPVMQANGFPVEQLTLTDAARRYPQIELKGVKSVWLERRAGALSARRACAVVRDAFQKAGGSYRTAHVEVPQIDKQLSSVRLADGSLLEADAFVFACGPWLGQVFPDLLGEAIQPSRQEVCYFGAPRGSERYQAGRLPIWVDFGERVFYGIPDLGGSGFKIADDTRGEAFDPTNGNRKPTEEGLARVREALAARFPELANAPLLKAEVCQYENSPDGNLIIDRHPRAPNVWLAGGGSGHGFKLAPAVGEMVASRILAGNEVPKMFHLDRLRNMKKRGTQLDRN